MRAVAAVGAFPALRGSYGDEEAPRSGSCAGVCGWVRVCQFGGADGGGSLAQQRAAIEGYAIANRLVLVEVIEDGGVSAGIPFAERPGGARAVEILGRGEVAVATRLDRAFRSSCSR